MNDDTNKDEEFDIEKALDANYRAEDIDRSDSNNIGEDIFVVSSISAFPVEYLGVTGDYCFFQKPR